MTTTYTRIAETRVPGNVRFDCPARNAGQMIEVEYGGFSRACHDVGDEYTRVTDRTTGRVTYYRLAVIE